MKPYAVVDRGFAAVRLLHSVSRKRREDEDSLIQSTDLIDLRKNTLFSWLVPAGAGAGDKHASVTYWGTVAHLHWELLHDLDDVGASPARLWTHCENFSRTISPVTCSKCADNRFRNDDCLLEDHPCLDSVYPSQVIDWLAIHLA